MRTQALRAMELSKNRAAEIRRLLSERYSIDAARIDVVGRGWEEPVCAGLRAEPPRRSAVVHDGMKTQRQAVTRQL